MFAAHHQACCLKLVQGAGQGTPKRRFDPDIYLGDERQIVSVRTIFAGSLRELATLYKPIELQLPRILARCDVGWGTRDPFFALEHGRRTAAALRAQLTVFEGAGHFLPEERPEDLAQDLRQFLQSGAPAFASK